MALQALKLTNYRASWFQLFQLTSLNFDLTYILSFEYIRLTEDFEKR